GCTGVSFRQVCVVLICGCGSFIEGSSECSPLAIGIPGKDARRKTDWAQDAERDDAGQSYLGPGRVRWRVLGVPHAAGLVSTQVHPRGFMFGLTPGRDGPLNEWIACSSRAPYRQ